MRFMSFPHNKIFSYIFLIGLLTFMISMATYSKAYPRDVRSMNYTGTVPIAHSTLPMPLSSSLGDDSQYNCLTSDGSNYIQQYKEVNDQDYNQLRTLINDSLFNDTDEMFEDDFTGSDYDQIDDLQTNHDNLFKVHNNIQKMRTVYQNLFTLHDNKELRKQILRMIPVGKFENIQEIAKPVLCLLNQMSNDFKLEIDIKEDARYFFEFQLVEFLKKYVDVVREYHDKDFNIENKDVQPCNEKISKLFIDLFKSQYKFSNEPMHVISSSYYGDIHNIEIDENNTLIRNVNATNENENATEFLSNVYEIDLSAKTGKNITLFDFPFERIFKADMFKKLNFNNSKSLKGSFYEIYKKTIQNVKNEIIKRRPSNSLDSNNEVVILMPSKREFFKLACLYNFKDLYDTSSGIYFYKYDDFNLDKDAHKSTDIKNYVKRLSKLPKCMNLLFYKEFSQLHDKIVKNLDRFLKKEVHRNLIEPRSLI